MGGRDTCHMFSLFLFAGYIAAAAAAARCCLQLMQFAP